MPYYPDPHNLVAPWEAPTDPLPRRSEGGPPIPPPSQAGSGAAGGTPPSGTSAWTAPTRAVPPRMPSEGKSPRSGPPRRWRIARFIVLPVLVVALVLSALFIHRLYDFGTAVSTQPPLSTQTGYMLGADRVNLLVMGYGGGAHDGANLTDSMMVISLIPHDGATTMISVPRDLWVQVPPNSGRYTKINAAYQDGLTNGYGGMSPGKAAAGAEAAAKVSDVLGLDVNYWLTIDFTGFRQLVDALGGVDINVPTAFTARYPRNDNPAIDAGWKIIHFNTGTQHMSGEQAIEYARARYVLDPPSEGTDFARSARQQLLIRAILSRARQPSAWSGLMNATDALQGAILTNLSLADLALFAQKMDSTHATRIGLTNQNVLVDAQSGDGQDILLPENGDWTAIQRYVASNLKS